MSQCPVSLLCSHGVRPNTSLGSCPSRYHLCFPKSISEIFHVPFASMKVMLHDTRVCLTKPSWCTHCSSCWFPSLRSTAPCLCSQDSRSAGWSVLWSQTKGYFFRPTLGQRSRLELCHRTRGGCGVERGFLQPASRPKPVYHKAVTGANRTSAPASPGGLENTWGVLETLMSNHFWPIANAKEMCCCVTAQVGTCFQLQKMIKLTNYLCISWSLWVSVSEVTHWGANNAFLVVLWVIASTALGRRASLWPGDPLGKVWCFQRLLPFPDAGGTNVASCNRQAVLFSFVGDLSYPVGFSLNPKVLPWPLQARQGFCGCHLTEA